jgi:NAD(P)-dependent dehydrogenase (short-subunit alcohol dehydrogenase family)
MELSGKVVVVTGGASGIGRAMALRFAEAGARVAVADLREEDAAIVAGEVGAAAIAIGCDVADDAQMAALIERTEAELGSVDLFCANAGVGIGTDPMETPLDVWDLAFDVNVRAHVTAARLLLPGWLERGEGYFLTTASAAGLLTQIGSAPYAVTKHAAVAFAEWLSVTYGDRGVRVSCLCPMGVNTPLMHAGDGRGGAEEAASKVVQMAGKVLEPEEVADIVLDALGEERFLILPHPEVLDFFRYKGTDYDRWLAGMRRLQTTIVDAVGATDAV